MQCFFKSEIPILKKHSGSYTSYRTYKVLVLSIKKYTYKNLTNIMLQHCFSCTNITINQKYNKSFENNTQSTAFLQLLSLYAKCFVGGET